MKGVHDLDAIYDKIEGKEPTNPLSDYVYVIKFHTVLDTNTEGTLERWSYNFQTAHNYCLSEGKWTYFPKEDIYYNEHSDMWRKIEKVKKCL